MENLHKDDVEDLFKAVGALDWLRDESAEERKVENLLKNVEDHLKAVEDILRDMSVEEINNVRERKKASYPSDANLIRRFFAIYVYNFNVMNQTFHSIKGRIKAILLLSKIPHYGSSKKIKKEKKGRSSI